MKVVHLLPAMEQGGVETVVCDLTRVLARAGWEAVVVSKGGRLVVRVTAAGGRHVALDLKSKNPLTGFLRVLRLRRVIRAERPDLVCVHSRVPAWLYVGVRALDPLVRGIPWITCAHGANSVSRYSAVMTKGDLVVTPSRFLADYLKAHYGTDEAKIRVIPNAVDAVRFDPENLDLSFVAEKRREWGIRDGDHVLMAVGRITKVKGYGDLIRKFAAECGGDAAAARRKLVIVGGADSRHLRYLAALRDLAVSLSVPVVFAGAQSKIPECLSIADEIVSANTTKPESFGLSIVEAYAMNKPVRAKRFGGAAEVMAAVERAEGATLRARALSLYGFDKFAERTMATYRSVLKSARWETQWGRGPA